MKNSGARYQGKNPNDQRSGGEVTSDLSFPFLHLKRAETEPLLAPPYYSLCLSVFSPPEPLWLILVS